jgi:hypothetical protein
MGDLEKQVRTIVLVSHQLNQIRRLCHRVVWIDAGEARMDSGPDVVLAAYESAMFSGDRSQGLKRGGGTKAQFLRWGITEPGTDRPHVLSTLGPFSISFKVELTEPVSKGEHGVALFNAERQLMWANAVHNLVLEPGVHVFSHTFSTLPLRPGAYQWQVSLWDNREMLDLWDCVPEMTIATEVHQHYLDEWNGILNLAPEFSCHNSQEMSNERDARL